MSKFLKANYRKWPEISPKPCESYLRGPMSNDFSYDGGNCRIGYDFNASGYEREYAFTIVRWIALKAGKLRAFQDPTGEFPFYAYDGNDAPGDEEGPTPIILDVGQPASENDWKFVDHLGIPSRWSEFRKDEQEFHLKIYGYDGLPIIRKEMERLNSLFQKS